MKLPESVLLPKLADHVLSVYVETTTAGTEARLLNKLRNLGEKCPELPMVSGLTETMAVLSGGQATPITDSIDSSSISCSHNNLGRRFLEV